MANTINITVTTNANAAGQQITKLTADITALGKASGEAGSTGRDALNGFAGGLGIPTSVAALTGAIATGIVGISVASVRAANEAAVAQRILKSDAQEAGVSLAVANQEAQKFGDDLALSNTEAQESFSKLLRVIKASGEVDNTAKYQKNITNLIAAYGIAGNEIDSLFKQILSGQDEALNKLGISDPSQIYKKYADQTGKVVANLSQEEKVRATLNALSEKGEHFAGAAEDRLASSVGQWAQLGKAISDASVRLGDYLNKVQIGALTVPQFLKMFVDRGGFDVSYALNIIKQQRDAAANAQFQEEQARLDKFEQKSKDALGVPEALKNPFGSFNNRVTLLGREGAEKERAGFVEQYKSLFADKQLDRVTADFAERQFNEIKNILNPKDSAKIEDEFKRFWDKYAKVALGALKDAREGAEKFYASATERGDGANNPFIKVLLQADEATRNLQKTFGVLGDSAVRDLQKIEDKLTRQKLLTLEVDAELKANGLRRQANDLQNPAPGSLTGREERGLNTLNDKINAAVNSPGLLAIADALGSGRVGNRKVDAEELIQRQYARNRGLNFDQLTESQKYLATRGRQGEIDRANSRLQQNPLFLSEGLNVSQDSINKKAIANLRDLSNFGLTEGATFGEKAKDALNSALVNLFNSLSPELQASIAKGGEGATVLKSFRDAFTGTAQALQEKVKEEINKQAVVDRTVKGVREDIDTIGRLRRQGLSTTEADARFLATTGALDSKELPADIRAARIEVLRREADRQVSLQQDAINANKANTDATDKLTKSIDDLAGEIRKPENRKLLVEIRDKARASVRTELYGSLTDDDK